MEQFVIAVLLPIAVFFIGIFTGWHGRGLWGQRKQRHALRSEDHNQPNEMDWMM